MENLSALGASRISPPRKFAGTDIYVRGRADPRAKKCRKKEQKPGHVLWSGASSNCATASSEEMNAWTYTSTSPVLTSWHSTKKRETTLAVPSGVRPSVFIPRIFRIRACCLCVCVWNYHCSVLYISLCFAQARSVICDEEDAQ